MSNVVPVLATAITLGHLPRVDATHPLAAAAASHVGNGVSLLLLLLGLLFLASVIGVGRQIAALMSLLLQAAVTVGAALVLVLVVAALVLVVAALAIVALLH
jgi:hypothetical protein